MQAADINARIDDRVLEHINHLVDERIFNVGEMMFYPSRADLRKIIYRRRQRQLSGLLDQEAVLKVVEKYSVDMCDSTWFFRPSSAATEDIDATNICQSPLLLVLQTSWQRRLLQRYGHCKIWCSLMPRTVRHAMQFRCFSCVCTLIVDTALSLL